jgi:hypothetical protein
VPTVRLGNRAAIDRGQILEGNRVTTIQILDENDLGSRMRTITHADGLWPNMSVHPAAWVECDDDSELESALATHFGCPVGMPASWI